MPSAKQVNVVLLWTLAETYFDGPRLTIDGATKINREKNVRLGFVKGSLDSGSVTTSKF